MQKIRNQVFETNSSSCHSIVLGKKASFIIDASLTLDSEGVLTIEGGQYGWEWARYNDAKNKASYALTQLGDNKKSLETLELVLKYRTKAKVINFIYNSNDHYIDHDSYGILDSDKDTLDQFIFNKNSFLFTGNDNEHAPPEFYDLPGTNYTYKLTVKEYPFLCCRFTEYPSEKDIINFVHSTELKIDKKTEEVFYFNNRRYCYNSNDIVYEFNSYRHQPLDFKNQTITLIRDDCFGYGKDNTINLKDVKVLNYTISEINEIKL